MPRITTNAEPGAVDGPALAAELARLAGANALAGSYRLRLGEDRRIDWLVREAAAERTVGEEPDGTATATCCG